MMYDLIVVGGGAGGCFAALQFAGFFPGARVIILEAARKPLSKVEISGGGRCNVTHACFDPEVLIHYYPRGGAEMLKPFMRFQPSDMMEWFEKRGVRLKIEDDGRVFPVSDSSATIIDCFLSEIRKFNIHLSLSTRVLEWEQDEERIWNVRLYDGQLLQSRFLLIATGSDQRVWNALKAGGYAIIPPVPSLFTFNIRDKDLVSLMGISKTHVTVMLPAFNLHASGPLLITHWGLSGPAVLKLSAWGARHLYEAGYVFDVVVQWITGEEEKEFVDMLQDMMKVNPIKQINKYIINGIPSRLWKYLCSKGGVTEFMSGAEFGKKQWKSLMEVLTNDTYRVTGKSTFKEEFVTAGGIDLDNVNMERFESKRHQHLFFVGEVLNIDALTGGYNFQAAWTGAHIAAMAMASGKSGK
jgi:predicted Rossmann fold flavoprotein